MRFLKYVADLSAMQSYTFSAENHPNNFKKITKPQNNVFYGRLWFLNLTNHSIEVFLFHTD